MIAADSSVAVAAALPWHVSHAVSSDAIASARPRLVAHAAIETFSTLTRLPPAHRVPGSAAIQYLRETFGFPVLTPTPNVYELVLDTAVEARILGGAVYDALIAATAREAGALLLTLDRRASTVYQRLGVEYRLLA